MVWWRKRRGSDCRCVVWQSQSFGQPLLLHTAGVGHLPIHYNRLPSDKGIYRSPGTINKPGRDYVFSTPEPLWPFGYRISYSDFEYSDFCFNKENYGLTDTVRIQVNVKNKSAIEGKSTVQVYVRDLAGSVVMPMKQLKGFSKVTVPAYGSTLAEISVPVSELGLYDMNMAMW